MSLKRTEKPGKVGIGEVGGYGKKVSKEQNNAQFCKDNKWNVADRYYSVHFIRVSKGRSGRREAERVLQKKENK